MAATTPEVFRGHTVAMRSQYRLVELMNEVYRRLEHSERRGDERSSVEARPLPDLPRRGMPFPRYFFTPKMGVLGVVVW